MGHNTLNLSSKYLQIALDNALPMLVFFFLLSTNILVIFEGRIY
jgi:hypothetical protein